MNDDVVLVLVRPGVTVKCIETERAPVGCRVYVVPGALGLVDCAQALDIPLFASERIYDPDAGLSLVDSYIATVNQ